MNNLNRHFNLKFNEYMFNNSIIDYDGYFIMTYRFIKYFDKEKIHPWSAWSKGFNNTNKNIIEKNPELIVNPKLYALVKYRSKIDNDYFISMDYLDDYNNENVTEIDTTGIAIFKTDNFVDINIIYNNPVFFINYNHDSRLCKIDNTIYITYNGFFNNNDILKVKMMYRKLFFNLDERFIYIGSENQLVNTNKAVEKNCIIDLNNNILYNINGSFDYIINNNILSNNIEQLQNIINYYGKDNIIFSLGTPIQKYNNLLIGLGHVKIDYRNIKRDNNFNYFIKSFNWKNIKIHGRYIYFMFFFTYDNNYKIKHLSNCFIPTDNNNSHLPYLLVFPTGLLNINNNYIITYGEGDEFSKLIIMNKDEIERLLINIDEIDNYNFGFYNVDIKEFINPIPISQYLIIGYYWKYNCGDDAFAICFDKYFSTIDDKYYSYYIEPNRVKDYYKYLSIFDNIIVGGGDIINSYFMEDIIKLKECLIEKRLDIKIIGISIGIPYLDNIKYLNYLDNIYLRNYYDYEDLINNKYPEVSVLKSNIHYSQDICFLLDKKDYPIDIDIDENKINVGVFLCRTFYNRKYEDLYFNMILKLSKLLNEILKLNDNIIIYLIPFNININNNKENDCLINQHIKSLNKLNNRIIDVSYNYFNTGFIKENEKIYVRQIDTLVRKMKIGICSRFHSHIFCYNNNVPFISLSCTRKVYELLKYMELLEYYSKIDCINDVPKTFDCYKTLNLFKIILYSLFPS